MIALTDLQKTIIDIESTAVQKLTQKSVNGALEFKPYQHLIEKLSGNLGAIFIRFMLWQLGVDENYVLRWRLENKYRQYQVLTHYIPGCMPMSIGLSEFFHQADGKMKIRELFSQGYFLKATLGDASFATQRWDKTSEFESIWQSHDFGNTSFEDYILQKKLPIEREFRIHTFCHKVIPKLSYKTPPSLNFNRHDEAERYVAKILESLPDQILQGTLIGWDIALTTTGEYYIIEANFTGFHPQYRKGFQTTGLADDYYFGPILIAWLNAYFRNHYGISVVAIDDIFVSNYPFYQAFVNYNSIFADEHIHLTSNDKNAAPFSVIIYLGADTNTGILNLIEHFLMVDFADSYYVIIQDGYYLSVQNLFRKIKHVTICKESDPFTKQQHELLIQLNYDRRKQIASYHAFKSITDRPCIII